MPSPNTPDKLKKKLEEIGYDDTLAAEVIHALSDYRPQMHGENANIHTERGLYALERSIEEDGLIGAITVAADGETFDGSARIEKWTEMGFENPIIVETDGTRPIVHVRTDIPSASDPRARRLSIAANRVAELDLSWNTEILSQLDDAGILSQALFTPAELDYLYTNDGLEKSAAHEGKGGDDFQAETPDIPQRVKRGEIWRIGDHSLMCGDCTSPLDLASLLHDRTPQLLLTDPPYNVGLTYDVHDDSMPQEDYHAFMREWFRLWSAHTRRQILTPSTSPEQVVFWINLSPPIYIAPWIKTNSMIPGFISYFMCFEPIFFYGEKSKRKRANDVFMHTISEQRMDDGISLTSLHPCPKPLPLWIDLIENFSDEGSLIVDPMSGSGTTLIAAHRTHRISLSMEISPRYCDLILARASAEGIGPIERIGPTE